MGLLSLTGADQAFNLGAAQISPTGKILIESDFVSNTHTVQMRNIFKLGIHLVNHHGIWPDWLEPKESWLKWGWAAISQTRLQYSSRSWTACWRMSEISGNFPWLTVVGLQQKQSQGLILKPTAIFTPVFRNTNLTSQQFCLEQKEINCAEYTGRTNLAVSEIVRDRVSYPTLSTEPGLWLS